MIKEVDDYKLIEDSGVLALGGARRYAEVKKRGLDKAFKNWQKVKQEPKLLEADKALYDFATGTISKAMLKESLGVDYWIEYNTLISKAENYRTTAIGCFRQMCVIWITGASGSGKSTLSRALMIKKFGTKDFGVSGNDGHIFDTYDGQSGFILEEFRSSTMRFSSLLSAIDNDNNSATEARYAPKDFSNCKLCIINSITNPLLSYSMFQDIAQGNGANEPLKQLIRRLDYKYLFINEDGTIDWIMLDDNGKVIDKYRVPKLNMQKVFGYMAKIRTKERIDMSDLLGNPTPLIDITDDDLPF